MTKYFRRFVSVALLALMVACGGAEDGDLIPPNYTYDGGLPQRTASTGPFTLTGSADTGSFVDVSIITSGDGAIWTEGDGSVWGVEEPFEVTGVNWMLTIDELDPGVNQITIEIADPIGNANVLTLLVTVDQEPPTITIDQFATPTPDSLQTIAGTVSDFDAVVEVQVDGTGFVTIPETDIESGIWKYGVNLASAPLVPHVIEVRATDNLGNQTDSLEYVTASIEVDAAADVFTIIEDDAGPVYLADPLNDATLLLNGTRTSGYTVGVTEISPSSAFTIDNATDPVLWTGFFSALPSGITNLTFGLEDDTVPTPVPTALQAKVMVVRDLSGPVLLRTTPAHGDTGVLTTTDIVLTFSESVQDILGVNADFIELEAADGTIVSFSTDPTPTTPNRTFAFTPDTVLAPSTKYTLRFLHTDPFFSVTDQYDNEFVRPSGLLTFTTQ